MKRIATYFATALLLAAPASAETLMTEYFTLLSPQDSFNSRGAPLTDFCAIVQQDRANWHKFGKRDQADSADLFFIDANKRAMIAGKCVFDRGYYSNAAARIRRGESRYVYVRAWGNNGQVTRVEIVEGAG